MLRDMGGLIVIDFIDMTPAKHQREVEQKHAASVNEMGAQLRNHIAEGLQHK